MTTTQMIKNFVIERSAKFWFLYTILITVYYKNIKLSFFKISFITVFIRSLVS